MSTPCPQPDTPRSASIGSTAPGAYLLPALLVPIPARARRDRDHLQLIAGLSPCATCATGADRRVVMDPGRSKPPRSVGPAYNEWGEVGTTHRDAERVGR